MAKRKQSAKQRAASLRNLRKARRARKGAGESPKKRKRAKRAKTKTVRARARRSSPKRRRARRVAAETPKRRRRRRTAASRKRGATEAPRKRRRRARRAVAQTPKRRRRRSRARDWPGQPRRHAKAARKGWKPRRRKSHPHYKPRTRARRAGKKVRTKSGKYRTRKQIAASRRNIRKAQAARGGRKSVASHYRAHTKRGSRSAAIIPVAAESRRRRRRARRNPINATELVIGAFTGLSGFLIADVFDRFLATHALTGTAVPYVDTPPTTGDYPGLYNATAICAPMDMKRWLLGSAVTIGLPLGIAYMIKSDTARTSLQLMAFGAFVRIVGKGAIDGIAKLTNTNMVGQRLYDGEMRSQVLAANGGTFPATVQLPTAGLGKALGAKPPCAPCDAAKAGAGYPSIPRETTATAATPPAQAQMQPPPAQLPPPAAATAPPVFQTQVLTGVPRRATSGAAAPSRRRFNWGDQDS